MKNFFDNKVKVVLVLSFIYSLFSIFVYKSTQDSVHLAMIWNLFLAILPLLFSFLVIYYVKCKKMILTVLFGLLWLFFFPNAPYVVTDLIHLSTTSVFNWQTTDITQWLKIVHFSLLIILACFSGMLSLYNIHNIIIELKNKYYGWFFVLITSLLSGLAIYIGRFLRFNSWDIFNPNLYLEIINSINLFSVSFVSLFAFCTLFIYLIFYYLFKENN